MSSLEAHTDRAHQVLADGGLVLMPTDIGYGLVAASGEAVARIYELKGRPKQKPCVTVANDAILDDVAIVHDPRLLDWLADISLRTPIAVINKIRPESRLLGNMSPYMREQATTAGTVATFLNAGEMVSALAERARRDGRLLVGSSANLASTGNNYRMADVPDSIRSRVDLEIDTGEARYANPQRQATTILNMINYSFTRVGINHAMIEASWLAFRRDVLGEARPSRRSSITVRAIPDDLPGLPAPDDRRPTAQSTTR